MYLIQLTRCDLLSDWLTARQGLIFFLKKKKTTGLSLALLFSLYVNTSQKLNIIDDTVALPRSQQLLQKCKPCFAQGGDLLAVNDIPVCCCVCYSLYISVQFFWNYLWDSEILAETVGCHSLLIRIRGIENVLQFRHTFLAIQIWG